MIVVDTNVISELMKSSPEDAVIEWMSDHDGPELYTTAVTLAEIRYGIERLPEGRRRDFLAVTAEQVFAAFEDHVLPFDATAAVQYAFIVARCERAGSPIDGFDAQIASVCSVHGATLATRNVADFRSTGIEIVDPWRTAS